MSSQTHPGHVELQLVRLPKVIEITGLGRSSIYARIKTADFPKPVRLNPSGRGAVAWILSEILEWVRSRIVRERSD